MASHHGTYKDDRELLPQDSETIKKCIELHDKMEKGLKVSCGHDFWEKAQKMHYGEVIHCGRCNQFFVKTKVLVWLTEGHYWHHTTKVKDRHITYGTNHLDTTVYVPYSVRVTREG